MSLRKAQNAIKAVEARLQLPFEAKKQTTPLKNKIGDIFSIMGQINTKAQFAKEYGHYDFENDIRVFATHPLNVKNCERYPNRQERMAELIAETCPEYSEVFPILLDLYNQLETVYFPPTKAEEAREMERQQHDIEYAQKERGLRFDWISVQGWYCQNENGTTWKRYDWYLRGTKTAYQTIMFEANTNFQWWLENGEPDMSNMSFSEVRDFWETAKG
jgi:hypothetical protein